MRPSSAWVRGVNAHLPRGVAVLWAQEVSEDFHARFSAQDRTYHYLLLNRAVRPAVMSQRLGWFHQPLDCLAMSEASACLVGTHDFSAFRAAECQAKSPVRHMQQVTVDRNGDLVIFTFKANAFLHHMVRNLVGALVYVGAGRSPVENLQRLLLARDRKQAPPTFAPDGLYLTGVGYGAQWDLPRQSFRLPVMGG